MMTIFILLQIILLLFMLFHDWVSFPPLNDIKTLKIHDSNFSRLLGSLINGITVLFPLIICLRYYEKNIFPQAEIKTVFTFYFLLTIGTILSWWVPYFFGSPKKHKEKFNKFKNTHHFLPERGDNVIPNTLHVILHLQVWACLAISIYFLTFFK